MYGFLKQIMVQATSATLAAAVNWGAAWAADAVGGAQSVPAKPAIPTVVALADDDCTRGDWIGTYGSSAYLLCGMRAPESLSGGAAAIDSKEAPRAWLSSAAAEQDRSVLLEPSGLKRTPACWRDWGDASPQAHHGPDLYVKVSIPEGPFLLSLYFFEIDWPQYRAYRIRILTDEDKPAPILTSNIDNFLKGKYKRFAILGPAKLLIVVNRQRNPDAQVSGIFLDPLGALETPLLDSALPPSPLPAVSLTDGAQDVTSAAKSAEDALALLLATPAEKPLHDAYIRKEIAFFKSMRQSVQQEPESYCRNFESLWQVAEGRTRRAQSVLHGQATSLTVRLLNYYASRGGCNYEGARQAIRLMVRDLSLEARNSGASSPHQIQLLQDDAVSLMQMGHRGEAEIALRALATACLDLEKPDRSRERLCLMGKQALRAGVSVPIAEGLVEWENRHGSLPLNDRLLLGNLYYVAGKNDEALAIYEEAEPKLRQGDAHRWLLIAMMTAHLRKDRVEEAKSLMERLRASDPNVAEIEEAQYRFGAHYFELREFEKARQYFAELRDSSQSSDYRQMAAEYLGRIEQISKVTNSEMQRER